VNKPIDEETSANLLDCFHCGRRITQYDCVKNITIGRTIYKVHNDRCFDMEDDDSDDVIKVEDRTPAKRSFTTAFE
jgi:hypothetical protein